MTTKLPRQIWVLGFVSFFADVSGEMIYPVIPLFVVAVLGASTADLGWIEGVAQALVAAMTAYAGVRSDRFRRRLPWVRWGYGLPVLGKAIVATAVSWPLVLLGRAVDRAGKGFRSSPRDALIADSVSANIRGRAYGLHRAMDTAGALVGSLAAAVLLWWLTTTETGERPYRIIFAVAAAMGLAAVALTLLLRESPHTERTRAPESSGALRLPHSYWLVLAMLVVFALANSSDTFLLLRAAHVGLSPWQVVIAYAGYNVVYTVGSYPAGALSDRLGRWVLIGAGWTIYALVYAGVAVSNATTIWPLFAIYGLYMALTDGVGKALIADHAPAEHRGRALGIYYLATGVTALVSSVLAGVLWDKVDPSAPFWLGAATAALAVMILIVGRKKLGSTT